MKVYVLVWLDGGPFTIELPLDREGILAFNDANMASAFATRTLRRSGIEGRSLATVEVPVEGKDVKHALKKWVQQSPELDDVQIICDGEPLFDIIILQMVES